MAYALSANDPKNVGRESSLRHDLATGVIMGQIAGLIMAVVVMVVFTIFLGKGPLYPVQVIGSFAFGDRALEGFHVPAFVAGLLLHQLGPALLWGVVFGLAAHGLSVRSGASFVILGLAIGVLSQVIDVNIVMRTAMNAFHGHNIWAEQVPSFWSWAAHLVFGLAMAMYPRIHAGLARRFA